MLLLRLYYTVQGQLPCRQDGTGVVICAARRLQVSPLLSGLNLGVFLVYRGLKSWLSQLNRSDKPARCGARSDD